MTEPYLPKYKSSYWQVMILGMLGLRRTLPSVRKAIEHVFQFQHPEGGFAECGEVGAGKKYKYLKERAEKKERVMPPEQQWIQEHIHEFQLTCLTGNVCLALIRLGYASDRRVKRGLKWLVKVQNEDGGWLCPYWKAHAKDKHGCFMGTITPLDAFSEMPARLRTSEMVNSLETGIEFLLKHRLFRADHHDFKVIKESWLTVAQNLYKSGHWIQDCCLVPGSSRQHCDSSGHTMSYSLSAGIYCPRPTDGDCRTVLRLGSRFRLGSTYNDSFSEYIRTYRMRVFYPIFI